MEQNANVLGDGLYELSRDALAALTQELCRQLTARGSYHGGIRPDNIVIDEQGSVSLGEEMVKDPDREWSPSELEYIAPEVFWNGKGSPAADVYSMGMLLYAGVTGGHLPLYPEDPTPNDQADALRRRMSGEALTMPRTAGKHLAEVMEKATQFRPDDRYPDPQALSDALEIAREQIREYNPPAREMFDKPVQELTDMERLLLEVLTEKRQAEEAARREAERIAAEEEAARLEAERIAAEEEAARLEAERKAAEEAAAPAESEEAPEPAETLTPELLAAQMEDDEPAPLELLPEESPEADVPEAPEEPSEPETVKKPGVDPALVQAISASVAARMSEPVKSSDIKDTPTVPPERQQEEADRISRQLEQMDWIGHNRSRRDSSPVWIVLLLCAIAVVLGALILHSIGAIGRRPAVVPGPEESPYESVQPADTDETAAPDVSAEPDASAEPTETPEPTATPEPKPKYEIVLSNASWEQAKAEAEAKGGHLAVISSAEELQQIADMANAAGVKYVWIGLSRNDSGELVWVKDNPTPYVVWAPGEPSVRDSYTGQPENYVLIANSAGAWSFNDCGNDPAAAYPRFYSGLLAYIVQYD